MVFRIGSSCYIVRILQFLLHFHLKLLVTHLFLYFIVPSDLRYRVQQQLAQLLVLHDFRFVILAISVAVAARFCAAGSSIATRCLPLLQVGGILIELCPQGLVFLSERSQKILEEN